MTLPFFETLAVSWVTARNPIERNGSKKHSPNTYEFNLRWTKDPFKDGGQEAGQSSVGKVFFFPGAVMAWVDVQRCDLSLRVTYIESTEAP